MDNNELDFFPLLADIKQEVENQPSTSEKATNDSINAACDSVENSKNDQQATDKEIKIPKKCCWCQQILTAVDRPQLLECFHGCCSPCIQSKLQEQQKMQQQSCGVLLVQCPICKMDNRSDFIIDNQFLLEIINSTQSDDNASGSGSGQSSNANDEITKCPGCGEETPPTSWCVDCNELICDSCVQAHQRLKITKDHTIKSKDAADSHGKSDKNQNKEIKCQMHPQEILSLFCETCDRLTCRDCQLLDHRDHKYKFATEIASETRGTLTSLLSEISYKKVLLSSAMKVIDDRQALIAEKKTELSTEIAALVVKLTSAVSNRGKQLVYRLSQVCENKLQTLNEKKEALQQLSGHTDHCIEFVQNALENGSDGAVLYSKKTLSRHLNKVKCQRADIPNPEIPVRVQLFLSNVPELQNVISRIGTILVDGKVYPHPAGPSVTPPLSQQGQHLALMEGRPSPQHHMQQPQQQQQGQHLAIMEGRPSPQHHMQQPQQQQQQHPRQKHTSPNVTPPLRPGGGNGMGSNQNAGYNTSPSSIFPPNVGPGFPGAQQMSRSYSGGEGSPNRFPMPGSPHGMGPPSQHVSSSTHPNMGNQKHNLRGLLSHQTSQNFMASNYPNMPPGSGQPPSAAHAAHVVMQQQLRQNFMNQSVPPGHPAFPGNNGPNQMAQVNARYQQQFQRFGPQMRQQSMMPSMKVNNGMRFPPSQQSQMTPGQNFNQNTNNIQQQQQQMQLQQMQQQQQSGPSGGSSSSSGGSSSGGGISGGSWHKPQQKQQQQSANAFGMNNNLNISHMSISPTGNSVPPLFADNFKIPLKSPDTLRQNTVASNNGSVTNGNSNNSSSNNNNTFPIPNVSSTNPKTPSPSGPDTQKDIAEDFDLITNDSVNDLMATIAKLDSNGVQVLPEGRNKATSPQVHSSTDSVMDMTGNGIAVDKNNQPKDDPNEDWCAVCMDGGELMCCDKCPKVFHQGCHIPVISSLPDESETWQCLLCFNFADQAPEAVGEKRHSGLSSYELKILQRILLELLCQYELSSHFRMLPPETSKAYYEIVCNPISLNCVRDRLVPAHMEHYQDIQGFINDCRRLFNNAYLFYQEDSKTYHNARELEKFFDMQLKKWLPKYAKSVMSTPQQQKSYNMCDFLDDGMIDDPTDEDFIPKSGAKRPRSTPSV